MSRTILTLIACLMLANIARANDTNALFAQKAMTLASNEFSDPLRKHGVAGIAVSMSTVQGDLFTRTFGEADPNEHTPLTEDALFPVASVTKFITAIAALQLVEEGKLELHAPIRNLQSLSATLRTKLKDVTLHQLLTHTSGLGDDFLNIAELHPITHDAMNQFLMQRLPPQITRPNKQANYTNFGFGVIGAVIETASRQPFGDHVEHNVFSALGLQKSVINSTSKGRLATTTPGFFYRGDIRQEPRIFEYMPAAGAALMTAPELAKLLTAVLQGDQSLKLRDTGKKLIQQQWQPTSGAPGATYGGWVAPGFDEPVITLGGEIPGYSTRALLLPSRGVAIVICVNRKDPTPAVRYFEKLLHGQFVAKQIVDAGGQLQIQDGQTKQFRPTRYPHTNFLKIASLFGPTLTVSAKHNAIQIDYAGISRSPDIWHKTPSGGYVKADGSNAVSFAAADDGRMLLHFSDILTGPTTLEEVSAIDALETQMLIVAGLWLSSIAVLLVSLARSILRFKSSELSFAASVGGLSSLLAASVTAVFFPAFVTAIWWLAVAADDRFAYSVPLWITATTQLPYAALALLPLQLLNFSTATARAQQWLSLLSLAATASFIAWCWHWSIITSPMPA